MSDRSDDPDEELARTAEELADSLRDLRREVAPRPRRGPLGLPRPPSPREVLDFTDDVAIPTAIAILEANIKVLEAIQRAIRLANAERRARERGGEVREQAQRRGRDVRDTATRVGEETLNRLDAALADLQTAVDEGSLPQDETAREILTEARSLRDELDRQARDASERVDEQQRRERGVEREDGVETDAEGESGGGEDADEETGEEDDSEPVQVDVDSELKSLRQRYDKPDDDGDEE